MVGVLLVELVTPMKLEVTLAVPCEPETRIAEIDTLRRQCLEQTPTKPNLPDSVTYMSIPAIGSLLTLLRRNGTADVSGAPRCRNGAEANGRAFGCGGCPSQ